MTDNLQLQQARLMIRSITAGLPQVLNDTPLVVDFDDMTGVVEIERTLPTGTTRKVKVDVRSLVAFARFAQLPLDGNASPDAQPELPGVPVAVADPAKRLARRGDHATSKQAASIIAGKLTQIQAKVLEAFEQVGPAGLTDYELEERMGSHGATYRTRRAELTEAGRIYNTGKTRKVNGRARVVWAVTPESITEETH